MARKAVVQATIDKILQPEIIDKIATRVAELAEEEFNDQSRLRSLSNELKGVQTAIRNLLRLVEQGIDTEDIGDRLLALNSQKADLQKQISREENKKPMLSKDRIAFWLTAFINNGNVDNVEYQQRIIDTLVNRIFVFDTDDGGRKIVIAYNVSGNVTSTITLSDIRPFSSDIKSSAQPNKRDLPCKSLLSIRRESNDIYTAFTHEFRSIRKNADTQ